MSTKRKTWHVYATVVTGIYVGEVEAETEEDAIAWGEANAATPSLCHHCSRELGGDFTIEEVIAEVQP